ncbi:MAG TPA: beta-L-arabinofuranosidase domain-containing protein [Bryobacteraceae bacterium]|nr:beta-L-arabinofuranosidase domain-containing protein [Bryobacteraceae bacterium]
MQALSRRGFLTGVAAGAGSVLGGASTADTSVREKLHEFDYSDVKLTGGPLKRQFDLVHAHFLGLDNDRLLKVYRQRAGLPAPGEDMGGWYDADGFVPGHTIGQYISGLSRFARATGDPAAYAKVNALVEGYAATLGPRDYPFASAKAATTWPCYILDKYEIGMLDAWRLAGVAQAKDVLVRVIRGAIPYIPDHTYDRGPNSPKQAPYDEPYILPENLFHAFEATGEKEFFEMGKLYLLDREFFDPLAENKNILPGKHAYSHLIALSSGAKAWQMLGDIKYLNAIRNAWEMLARTQQYASGGSGPREAYVTPGEGKLGESITSVHEHFETPCGAYAHFKLARYLIRFTADARYGDGLERLVYNTMLACKDPGGDGQYFYYSDYHPQTRKGYYHRKWPCCSGTYVQGVADYLLNLYFHGADGIYVNLFAPSEVRWSAGGVPVKLVQSTAYPLEEEVEIRVEPEKPATFAVNLRIPGWLAGAPRVAVNGKSFDGPLRNQTFAAIKRRWKSGDTIRLRLPLAFRTEAIDDRYPWMVAVMRGPLMLVALDPSADLHATPLTLPGGLTRAGASGDVFEYLEGGRRVSFKPFHAVRDETYNTYFTKLG